MIKNSLLLVAFVTMINIYGQNENLTDKHKNTAYFNITRLSTLPLFNAKLETFDTTSGKVITDLPTNKSTAFSIQTINGYFISSNFSVAIGVGLDRYNNPNANTLPVFFDGRYYFSEESKSLYFVTNIGSLIKIKNGTRKGSMVNIGMGIKFPIKKNSRTFLVSDLSFSHKSVSLDGLPIRDSENFMRLNGIMISLGIIF